MKVYFPLSLLLSLLIFFLNVNVPAKNGFQQSIHFFFFLVGGGAKHFFSMNPFFYFMFFAANIVQAFLCVKDRDSMAFSTSEPLIK